MKTILKVLLTSALLLPFVAQAAPGDCATELGAVEFAIMSGNFDIDPRRGESNRSNLITKLDAVEGKVGLDKFSDAIDKLMDISDKATAWADPDVSRKLKLEDATGINNAVGAAIVCVGDAGLSAD